MPTQSDISGAYGGANVAPLTNDTSFFSAVRLDLGELNYAFDATAADLPTWQAAFDDHDAMVQIKIGKRAMTDIFLIANNYQYGTAPSSLRWDDADKVKLLFGTTETGMDGSNNNVDNLTKVFGQPETGVWTNSNILGRSLNTTGKEVISGEFMAYLSSVILGDSSKTEQFRNTALVTGGIDSSIRARMNKSGVNGSAKTNIMQSVYSGLVANEILLVKDKIIAAIDSASLYDASGSELSAFEAKKAAVDLITSVIGGYTTYTDVTFPSPSITVDAQMTDFDYNNNFVMKEAVVRVQSLINGIAAGEDKSAATTGSIGDMTTAQKVKAYITKCFYSEASVASHRYETYEKAFRNLVDVQVRTLAIINKNTDIFVSKPLALANLQKDSSDNVLISHMLSQLALDVSGIIINVNTMSTVKHLNDKVYSFFREAVYQNTAGICKCLVSAAPAAATAVNSALINDTHYELGSYDILRDGTTNNCKIIKMSTTNSAGVDVAVAKITSSVQTLVAGAYISSTRVGFVTPIFTADVYFTDIHYLLHSKLYNLAPERYVSVFDNIYDENFITNGGTQPSRWNIRGLPFFPGDTISYLITVSPNLSQNYAIATPKVRKYKVQLIVE